MGCWTAVQGGPCVLRVTTQQPAPRGRAAARPWGLGALGGLMHVLPQPPAGLPGPARGTGEVSVPLRRYRRLSSSKPPGALDGALPRDGARASGSTGAGWENRPGQPRPVIQAGAGIPAAAQ